MIAPLTLPLVNPAGENHASATVSVFAGQMYVGSGYRQMSNSLDTLVDSYVNRPRIMPAEKPLYEMPIIR